MILKDSFFSHSGYELLLIISMPTIKKSIIILVALILILIALNIITIIISIIVVIVAIIIFLTVID